MKTIAMALVLLAGCAEAAPSRDAGVMSDAAQPWSRAAYVATYDVNGDGRVDGTEGPLCDESECTVMCPDATGRPECRGPHSEPLEGDFVPACDFKPAGIGCSGGEAFGYIGPYCGGGLVSGPARCLLPWNDPRVIR